MRDHSAAVLSPQGQSPTGPRAGSLMHPFKNSLAQVLARAAISLTLGALRWPSIVALCGSITIMPRSIPAATRASSTSSNPRSRWRASQSAMPLPVRDRVLVKGLGDFWKSFAFTEHQPVDAIGVLANILVGFALFGTVFILPQYLGQVQRYNVMGVSASAWPMARMMLGTQNWSPAGSGDSQMFMKALPSRSETCWPGRDCPSCC